MKQEVEVGTRRKNAVVLIDVKGDVTAVTGENIEGLYQEVSKEGAKKIVFVFTPDCYINSGGIAVLIGIAAASKEQGQVIRVTGLSGHFQKIFSMMGLTKYTEIFPSEEAALAGF
jgi:stage II sporulation protein AA (anti-sigma F factor antagonist)